MNKKFTVKHSKLRATSGCYRDQSLITKDNCKWTLCPWLLCYENPWFGTFAITSNEMPIGDAPQSLELGNGESAADAANPVLEDLYRMVNKVGANNSSTNNNNNNNNNNNMPGAENKAASTTNADEAQRPRANEMHHLIEPLEELQRASKVVYVLPVASSGMMQQMMLPGMMTPQYGCATPQYGYATPQHPSSMPVQLLIEDHSLRIRPAEIPLTADLLATPTDPRRERFDDGTYGLDPAGNARPFALLVVSYTYRAMEAHKQTVRHHDDASTNPAPATANRLNGLQRSAAFSTAAHLSDAESEISPPFEPVDDPRVLLANRKASARGARSRALERLSDASESVHEYQKENETKAISPVVLGKRKRRESLRIKDHNDGKRKKVAPIVIDLNSRSIRSNGDAHRSSRAARKSHGGEKSMAKPKDESFATNELDDLIDSNVDLFPNPVLKMDTSADDANGGDDTQMDENETEVKPNISEHHAQMIDEQLHFNKCVDVSVSLIRDEREFVSLITPTDTGASCSPQSDCSENESIDDALSQMSADGTATDARQPNTDLNSNILDPEASRVCKICPFRSNAATKLVAHYTRDHPDHDVYISRMTKQFSDAVKAHTYNSIAADKETRAICPFCEKTFAFAFGKWITHFTHHTGEFEFTCSKCKTRITTKRHKKCRNAIATRIIDYAAIDGVFHAYLCRMCNYVQMSRHGVEKHVVNEHGLQQLDGVIEQFALLDTAKVGAGTADPVTQSADLIGILQGENSNDSNATVANVDNAALTSAENTTDLDEMAKLIEDGIKAECTDKPIANGGEEVPMNISVPSEQNASAADADAETETKLSASLLNAKQEFPIVEEDLQTRLMKAERCETIILLSSDEDEPTSPLKCTLNENGVSCYALTDDDD